MKEWTKDTEIDASIDEVWKLFDGSLEDMQKVMPNVIENEPIKVTDDGVGSIYRQKYEERNRVQSYDVETLEYVNTPDKKKLKISFTLAKMFEITATYELERIDETKTYFRYTTTNNPLKWYIKLLLTFAGDKIVVGFVEKVKKVAEKEADNKQEQE
ncbi:SRPBCC family protein [Virgibacillus ndiopensis]|uniref:SRPBCC family protein n=1 Tax=Virgibacillus ndiopensis TaxID=2004408 RepID=UPI000C087A22|nr:SRPBCC family protein [Virgibacillus ndiopensis]